MLDEEDGWKTNENEYLKIGIAFVREKDSGEEMDSELKLKGIEIQRLFGNEVKITFEAAYHLNKIEKQFQYFDKVRFDVEEVSYYSRNSSIM